MTTFTRTIIKDSETGELVLDLGDEICSPLGWQVGDILTWKNLGNGVWQLTKKTTSNTQ
jgi:DNA-binding Xre family transcriptional regulator